MTVDPDSGVRLLGEALPYADGAEDRLLEVLRGAADRRAGSDELFASVEDWPTRYHLSRLRANLLRPLVVGEGMRVLDVGAGTGALSRWLGEQGAQVTALEGSLARARVAAARCEGLGNVEVLCGPLDALEDDDAFDLVVVCGVLEYSGAGIGGAGGPAAFLDAVRALCRPQGSVALAIENRVGLKYLLGYAEDHLGRPFAGIEGYRSDPGVRTWSRAELGSMLAAAGLGSQTWLFPFPDYKLPTLVLAEEAYRQPDAVELVDQLARLPVMDYSMPPLRLADERAAHAGLVAAGLGPDVANSFLVVASPTEGAEQAVVEQGVLAWRFGDERERRWLRTTRVHPPVEDGPAQGSADGPASGRRVTQRRTFPDVEAVSERGWLRQVLVPEAPYHRGTTFEQQAFAAARDHDLDGVRAVVRRWRDHLRALEAAPSDGLGTHPFLPEGTTSVLPGDHLDIAFDNFVDDGRSIHFIDPEWQLPHGVSTAVVVRRALWSLARRFVTTGVDQPWPEHLTVDDLAGALAAMCDEVLEADDLVAWFRAEGELQQLVGGQDPDEVADEYAEIGRSSRADQPVSRRLPFTRLQAVVAATAPGVVAEDGYSPGEALRRAEERIEQLQRAVSGLHETLAERAADIHRVVLHGERLEGELAAADAERRALRERRDELDARARELEARVLALEAHPALRAARKGAGLVRKGTAAARRVGGGGPAS
jgi:SAM-dependent methyltransferase